MNSQVAYLEDYRVRSLSRERQHSAKMDRATADELRKVAVRSLAARATVLERRVEEIARTVFEHLAERDKMIESLQSRIDVLSSQPSYASVPQDLVITPEEWVSLGEVLREPKPAPEWLRRAVLED